MNKYLTKVNINLNIIIIDKKRIKFLWITNLIFFNFFNLIFLTLLLLTKRNIKISMEY